MNIDSEEYSKKLGEFVNGEISKEEWIEYCQDIMNDIMDENSDVYVRMKQRGD